MGSYLQLSSSAMAEWRRQNKPIHKITWPLRYSQKTFWKLAERALGGRACVIAAYRDPKAPFVVRYYFRRA